MVAMRCEIVTLTRDERYLPPSGSNGLILGEIRGRSAGLGCEELFLFLPLTGVRNSWFGFKAEVFGVGVALMAGLGSTGVGLIVEALALLLCAETVGVVWLSDIWVSRAGRYGVESIAASPSEISCMSTSRPEL